jgi:hypothetical protein
MILIRYILIGLALYLVIRMLANFGANDGPSQQKPGENGSKTNGKKVSKEIGEYVDYEDVDK